MAVVISHFSILIPHSLAQIGEYRNDMAIGFSGGYTLSSVAFVTKVPQSQLGGITGGLTFRYSTEKYFKSICSVVAELNYSQIGWKEDILDINDRPVVMHNDSSQFLRYSRKLTYLQLPVFARLGWGRERSGLQFFFQVGPQFGLCIGDKSDTNFDIHDPAFDPAIKNGHFGSAYRYANSRVSHVVAQDTMAVENKFDYGIAGGIGLEFSHRKLGHFIVEGRYYYGLGNIYGSSKRDYFGRSNLNNIVVKFTYLFDLVRTKNDKIK